MFQLPLKELCYSLPLKESIYSFIDILDMRASLMYLFLGFIAVGGFFTALLIRRYRNFKTNNKISMHKEHKAGEEVEVDWSGDTLSYVDPSTGEIKPAYIFVAVLPASSYPFAYAYEDMKTPNWIDAHVRAYECFGGVPKITISDNTKTAVIKPDRIDPVLNKSYNEMARHYRTTILPVLSVF